MGFEPPSELPPAEGRSRAEVRCILRFTLGAVLAVAVSYGIGWDLSYMMPLFVAMFLGKPVPAPPPRLAFLAVAVIAIASLLALLLAVPVVASFQGRALPRRRGPALALLGVGLVMAMVWAWSSPIHDEAFPPRVQRWAGRP